MIKINKQTKEASREPLPTFLQGLKPESLYDLSWTDSNLGVQNFAWFDEQDITVYDSNLVFDGTESFEIDFENHLVKVIQGQRAKTVEELEMERKSSVPQTITKLQAMKQLKIIGKWESVKLALSQNEDMNDEWLLSNELNRTYPFVLQMATLLGFSETELDQFFIEASKLS